MSIFVVLVAFVVVVFFFLLSSYLVCVFFVVFNNFCALFSFSTIVTLAHCDHCYYCYYYLLLPECTHDNNSSPEPVRWLVVYDALEIDHSRVIGPGAGHRRIPSPPAW